MNRCPEVPARAVNRMAAEAVGAESCGLRGRYGGAKDWRLGVADTDRNSGVHERRADQGAERVRRCCRRHRPTRSTRSSTARTRSGTTRCSCLRPQNPVPGRQSGCCQNTGACPRHRPRGVVRRVLAGPPVVSVPGRVPVERLRSGVDIRGSEQRPTCRAIVVKRIRSDVIAVVPRRRRDLIPPYVAVLHPESCQFAGNLHRGECRDGVPLETTGIRVVRPRVCGSAGCLIEATAGDCPAQTAARWGRQMAYRAAFPSFPRCCERRRRRQRMRCSKETTRSGTTTYSVLNTETCDRACDLHGGMRPDRRSLGAAASSSP